MVTIRKAMDKKILKVAEGTTSLEAIKKMVELKVGHVLVVDKNGLPLGMINERDFLKRIVTTGLSFSTPVERIMSYPLITVDIDAPIGDAMKIMVEKNIRGVFVTEKGEIVGRITQTGLVNNILEIFVSLSTIT